MATKATTCEPIAIVGSSCRFPGPARNLSKLWELLQDPYDISTEIPPERFNIDAFYHPGPKHHGAINTRRAYFLEEDHRVFDAPFFQINAREAETMDPQQRLLLETVYEAMEAGGHSIESMQNSQTAVFVGGMSCDFRDTVAVRDPASIPEYSATGTHDSILAARISYFFDWKGPCMSIDTACSSSLVAVHQAVRALRNSEATAAVAAGSNLNLGPEQFISLSNLRMLSPNGRVRMWDKDADGYARGEGFGAVILKTLSRAEADGDRIECVIRESGVNQDGRTIGITMPNAESQTALIREVYKRAGLDVSDPLDKPQYFEAHGTGTPAGDPIEAEAIYHAFCSSSQKETDESIFVGSIKTVTGHLEGAAGIAGLLKASLAVQHGLLPPNLHFGTLNPKIMPFYDRLQILTGSAQPWPVLPIGQPRRASVNSFGFGGTNAHIILESYKSRCHRKITGDETATPLLTPLTISAKSEAALSRRIEALAEHIERNGSQVKLEDLAYTLQARQSRFPFKRTFSADSWENLVSSLRKAPQGSENSMKVSHRSTSTSTTPQILGIFTGQGAQSARMGAEIIERSISARNRLEYFDHILGSLPDPPSWSFSTEILAPTSSSRISEAELSQPLCTALQIIIVDHLRAAGIDFSAVLGHSSGEIAAAYAAGILSDGDAVCTAYYRGQFAKLAKSDTGNEGAMMATGMSYEDSRVLCEQNQFVGRLYAAASNSPSSSTLSGDSAAVYEAKALLDGNGIFARRLAVDVAYHSNHMHPVGDAYIEALQKCGVVAHTPNDKSATFVSSVYDDDDIHQDLGAYYWRDNMVRPVLFSQAVERAVSTHGPYDVVLEIGPHPALKGPVTETLVACGSSAFYCSTLERGKDSTQALSETLGFLYENIRHCSIRFEEYRKIFLGETYRVPNIMPGLPSYPWDHDRIYYRESRASHRYLHDANTEHGLLGRRMPLDNEDEMRWRHVISLEEVPWISEHTVQGQAVVPAMWYVGMAIEASLVSAKGARVERMEIKNFQIQKAIPMEDGDAVETVFSFKSTNKGDEIHASFWCLAGSLYGKEALNSTCGGELSVVIGEDLETQSRPKATREEVSPSLTPVNPQQFYDFLQTIGYGYYGQFRGLESLFKSKRGGNARNTASGASRATSDWLVHPATLDLALQSLLTAHFNLDDNGSPMVVPQSIDRLVIYPQRCNPGSWVFNAYVMNQSYKGVVGDVEITDEDGQAIGLIENVSWRPLMAATSDHDRKMFYTTTREWDLLHGAPITVSPYTDYEIELVRACDRVAAFYYRTWKQILSTEEWASAKWHHRRLLAYIEHLLPIFAEGEIPTFQTTWQADTKKEVDAIFERNPDSADLLLMKVVGENLPTSIREERSILEFMLQEERLANYYKHGLGYEKCYEILKTMVRRIVHRYPRMRILEIGAGTGGATRHILNAIDNTFVSYTFTDVSSGFFEKARESFGYESGSKMMFQTLDLEKDTLAQGFEAGTFDLIIGSLVVHATKSIDNTLSGIRALLKPGGYLLLVEGSSETLRSGFMMAGLPGWWVGDGIRRWGPMLELDRWDELLKSTGFSGVDTAVRDCELAYTNLGVVISSQAVTDSITFLREPLKSSNQLGHMTIVGEPALWGEFSNCLHPYFKELVHIGSLYDYSARNVPKESVVLMLSELDEPMLKSVTAKALNGMQELCKRSKKILILSQLCEASGAYASAMLGLVRSLRLEIPHIRIQTIGVTGNPSPDGVRRICECFLTLAAWPEDSNMLWSFESELELVGGNLLLPRLVEDVTPSERLNSTRRLITREVNPGKVSVSFSGSEFHGTPILGFPRQQLDNIVSGDMVATTYSIAQPVFLGSRPYYLCFGKSITRNLPVIAMGLESRSILDPFVSYSRKPQNDTDVVEWLILIVCHLFAQECVSHWKENYLCVLHDADDCLGAAFEDVCRRRGAALRLSSSGERRGHAYLPTHASRRQVQGLFLGGATQEQIWFIDCSRTGISGLINVSIPRAICLTPFADVPPAGSVWPTAERDIGSYVDAAILFADQYLKSAVSRSLSFHTLPASHLPTTSIISDSKLEVVDWSGIQNVAVPVRDVTKSFQLFRGDKTYLLVGLTGDMGRILVDWMVEHGARHIVLASRNPETTLGWTQELGGDGVIIRIYRMDVCDKVAVQDTRNAMLENRLPPVGGIANGAMVLRDTSFYEMRHEQMVNCLRPKVDGSKNLDEVFGDLTLDFFVMFSSLAYTLGNPGQSNYAAANGFMEGIARARRNRGQAASIISLGVVGGVGYLARTRSGLESEHARKRNVLTISPEELCTIFGEGIVAGRAESKHEIEVITGLDGRIDTRTADKESLAPWLADPRVSHIIKDRAQELGTTATDLRAQADEVVSLITQISKEDDESASLKILSDAFSRKLERMSLMQTGGVTTAPLTELGVDSLLAIEIRSWFMSELVVDVPVLKVLGGSTVSEIVKSALEMFRSEHSLSGANTIITLGTDDEPKSSDNNDKTRNQTATFAQARMYRLHQRTSGASHVNNMSWSYRVLGELDVPRFKQALQAVLRSYESLRTRFSTSGERSHVIQTVLHPMSLPLHQFMLGTEEEVDALFDQMAQTHHDPTNGQLVKAALVEKSPTEHVFIMSFHHIAVDTRSCEILLADLEKAYTSPTNFVSSHTIAKTHPADYAAVEVRALSSENWTQSIRFWTEHLVGANLLLPLFPCAKLDERRALEEYHLSTEYAYLPPDLVERIKSVCQEIKCSPYHFHTAVFAVLLHQITGVGNIIIGSVDAGRDIHQHFANAFGPMFNYLPLHLRDIPSCKTFKDLVRLVRDTSYAARSHAQVPFDVIVDSLGEERIPATHHPIYQAQINYLKHNLEEVPLGPGLVMTLRDARGVETQEYLYGIKEVMELGKAYTSILNRAVDGLEFCI
ncbi:Polyketide synthase-nonribosomal peptide synthetase [Cytospora mali]|uniref:Polyketide synthase-nonribosomal peptide synthetase n=1 Tax=Cytospora mali TaxID=578113 RepID=A0A194V078_CYTMA|nr:Polyketide synthase-nonribosomal peptide synthetase [Valsa mali var. pyri (nom. inval.)]